MLDFKEQLMAIKTEMNNEEIKSDNRLIETKVQVKDLDINKQIKQVKIEVNTNDKNFHNNSENNDVMYKPNYNKLDRKPQRREIWYVNLPKRRGSIQFGVRPCIISSNFANNQFSYIRNVFPITSKVNKVLPVHVELEGFGLEEKSLVLTEQVTTIDIRYDLMYYVGTVDEITMKRIDKARDIQLGDITEKTALEKLPKNIQNEINETLQYIYSYEKVLGRSKTNNLEHLLDERKMLLESLESICKENGLNYKDYYVEYSKERNVAIM